MDKNQSNLFERFDDMEALPLDWSFGIGCEKS